jgi:hypothetical protein
LSALRAGPTPARRAASRATCGVVVIVPHSHVAGVALVDLFSFGLIAPLCRARRGLPRGARGARTSLAERSRSRDGLPAPGPEEKRGDHAKKPCHALVWPEPSWLSRDHAGV